MTEIDSSPQIKERFEKDWPRGSVAGNLLLLSLPMILMEALYIAGKIMGVRAMVARYVGAGDIRCASKIAGQAIVLGALWGIIFTKFQSLCKNVPLLVEYPTLNNQA